MARIDLETIKRIDKDRNTIHTKVYTTASPQTWVLAMKNPRILRGLRRFYRNDQDH